MEVQFSPKASQISPMRSGHFAGPEKKEPKVAGASQDQLEISQEARQALAKVDTNEDMEQFAQKLETALSSMTRDEFATMVKEKLSEYHMEDKINWEDSVDPDGSIWRKTYMEYLHSQWQESVATIKAYYADALQEVLHNPFGRSETNMLNYISAKYAQPDSKYYVKGMSQHERQTTIHQLWSLVLKDDVYTLKDPYALKGKLINDIEVNKLAQQAADDRINALVQQAKERAGYKG